MNCRILVVEDSATQAEALFSLLEERGHEALVARSGEAALEQLTANEFDVIISDVVMPGMSGYELCAQVKENPRWRDMPLILLTSLADPMDIIQGLECGADNYITKPYEPDHLLARLNNVIENRRLRRNLKTSVGVTVRFLGRDLTVNSEKEQILDLFISSVEDVVRANEALQESQRALAEAHARLEEYAREKSREARISAEKYRVLLQNARDAVLVLDFAGNILDANRTATDMFGVPLDLLLTQSLFSLAAMDSEEELERCLARAMADGNSLVGERALQNARGEELWCDLTLSVTSADGDDLVLLIIRDVTERRASARELFSANQRLEALIASSPIGILVLDRDRKVQVWNNAAEEMFAWKADEAIGKYPLYIPEADRSDFEQTFERVLHGETIKGLEVSRVVKNGERIEVAIYASPLRVSTDEIEGGLALILDITERKRAEQAIRDREEAERANLAKSAFLSRMSHELRTPLNAILGFGQLMEMDDLGAENAESVDQILRAGRHLLALINEVLDLSQIEAGGLGASLEPVSIVPALEEVFSLMRPLATQAGVVLSPITDVPATAEVSADFQRLKQVLLNLVSNAIKYNRAGGTVQVIVSHTDEDWRISVADTGEGIAPERQNRLFHAFDRIGADSSKVQGTGLGLFLTKGLVEAMGGRIGVESVEGEGTTFWFELPRADSALAAPAVRRMLQDDEVTAV